MSLAWYTMSQWLQNIEYKLTPPWWVFAPAGLLSVGIALLTVCFRSVKAAMTNPVEGLPVVEKQAQSDKLRRSLITITHVNYDPGKSRELTKPDRKHGSGFLLALSRSLSKFNAEKCESFLIFVVKFSTLSFFNSL